MEGNLARVGIVTAHEGILLDLPTRWINIMLSGQMTSSSLKDSETSTYSIWQDIGSHPKE